MDGPLSSTLHCSVVAYTSLMSTPHISAGRDEFSDVCLLPGDPLRARYVAKRLDLLGFEKVRPGSGGPVDLAALAGGAPCHGAS